MPVYIEMIKDKKTGTMVEKKVDGQKQYYIRTYITDEYGNRKQITRHNKEWLGLDGKREATAEENRLQNKIHCFKNKIIFDEICNKTLEILQKEVKESTYISYKEVIKNQIKPFFENKPFTYELVFCWYEKMNKTNLSVAYLNKCRCILSKINQIGIKFFGIERNYINDIGTFKNQNYKEKKLDNKIRYISLDQFNSFISTIEDKLWYTFFYLLYYSGMRKGEAIALTWEDINFKNKTISVNKTYTDRTDNGFYKITQTKNYKKRIISMNDNLLNVLKEWYDEEKKFTISKKDFVFGKNKPLSTTTMTNRKNYYFRKAGIQPITIHEFRHSHVSLLINEYIKSGQTDTTKFFLMMSNRMGHTIQVMQETYMHLFPTIQDEIVMLLDNISKKQDQKQDQENKKAL